MTVSLNDDMVPLKNAIMLRISISELLRCYGLGLPILKNFHHLQLISTSFMFSHIYFYFSEHTAQAAK